MPEEAIAHDPMAYRYFDYPRTGSIYRLPDIPMIVRGKTYVQLPSGRKSRLIQSLNVMNQSLQRCTKTVKPVHHLNI